MLTEVVQATIIKMKLEEHMNFKKAATIAAAAGALAALAVPAMAETTLYGQARLATFYNIVDTEAAGINNGNSADYDEHLQGNARLGINFSDGKMTGKVEYGTGVNLRLLYGSYKFDFGSVLIGQDYNKYWVGSDQVAVDDNGNNGYGALWDTRQAQIRLTLNNGFYLGAIQPSNTGAAASENYLPKVNVGYDGKAGNFTYGVGVVGQTYKQTVAAVGAVAALDDTVTSVMGYFHGKLVAGPTALLFNLGVGQNMGDMNFLSTGHSNKYYSGENTTNIEGMVQGSYTFSPMVKLNAGLGYAVDDNDKFTNKDDVMAVFVNAPITLAKNFTVTPEISYLDTLDQATTNVKGDKLTYVGAKWQMNF